MAGLAFSGAAQPPATNARAILDYKFTNELGNAVAISDFKSQALAITFFFTRCPRPDFCPRLSKNFQEAYSALAKIPNCPTNWHFLSVSFDPEYDTPEVLRAYARTYHYDSRHWSFLTGPTDKIHELSDGAGVTTSNQDGLINHNFRTMVIDPSGHLQMVFPTGGNLSEAIVSEMRKALAKGVNGSVVSAATVSRVENGRETQP